MPFDAALTHEDGHKDLAICLAGNLLQTAEDGSSTFSAYIKKTQSVGSMIEVLMTLDKE